jgi:hypothetical protein
LLHSHWNVLVLADHEEPAWEETRRDLRQHVPLHLLRKIGKGQIPAQDDVKRLRGDFDAEILLPEFDQCSKFRAEAEQVAGVTERLPSTVRHDEPNVKLLADEALADSA